MKVLVVEENQAKSTAVREAFERSGHTCIVVPNDELAKTIQGVNQFDLVLHSTPPTHNILQFADLKMDLDTHLVSRGGTEIKLQPLEYQFLEYMLRHPGRVITKTLATERIWNMTVEPLTNVVESCVSRLRAKVDSLSDTKLIKTIKGFGYKLERFSKHH